QAAADVEGALAFHHRVGTRLRVAARGIEIAAVAERAAVARLAGGAADAEARAQLAGERLVGDHDAGLDHHLVHRLVELVDQLADVGDALGNVDHQQRVGALVVADAAARRQEPAALGVRAAGAAAALAV